NNFSLGYITLYFEDGTGAEFNVAESLATLRTYTYGFNVTVIRDGYYVGIQSIQPGDKVFINLDNDGYIEKISAKSFYKPVIGTVHYKGLNWLTLKKEDGTFAYYSISDTVPIYRNGKPENFSNILAGEKVKLLVQTDGGNIDIAGIEIEKTPSYITGIYRGVFETFDTSRDMLIVSNLQEFINGNWKNTSFIGIKSIKFSEDFKKRPAKRGTGISYFATQVAADGTEKIVAASYRSSSPFEMIIRDSLLSITGSNLYLQNLSENILFNEDTIVVKDGRLVDISAINTLDAVKISMERYNNGFFANIITCDSLNNLGLSIYRGRISDVEPEKSITVESFARLNGVTWEFTNTPKTFNIDLTVTRLFTEDGIGSMRDFSENYKGQTVYIVSDGTSIELISTAPYANSPVSGRISNMTGELYDSIGNLVSNPDSIELTNVLIYDTDENLWSGHDDIEIDIPVNAIVIKDGKVGSASLLREGDEIKVIRHSQNLDGILIICD
ncbi:MAG: hypothetical protein GX957_03545, partial [Clostridiaceae bacterium]|nr:hypothetical protein [Clostridiaceae bacterium]